MDASERRTRASEEAAHWWLRLSERELPKAEREQFIDWLRESSVHVAEMLRVAQVHGALESFERWTRIATEDTENATSVIPFPEQSAATVSTVQESGNSASPRGWWFSIAASVCAVAIALAWWAGDFGGQTIATERGERREVTLADGSVLQVGPETQLRVFFTEGERRIEFDHGATLFKVAKNRQRPFIVEAGGTVVRAVGTAFGVEHRGKGVVVTVSEGRVAVNEKPAWGVPFVSGSPPRIPEVALEAGHQIEVPRPGEIGDVIKIDSERELAWAAGRLVFENDSVAHAIEEFNRYNRVQMRVLDEAIASRPISAIFDASDPESFIAFIEADPSVRIVRSGDEVITIARAQKDATENSQ